MAWRALGLFQAALLLRLAPRSLAADAALADAEAEVEDHAIGDHYSASAASAAATPRRSLRASFEVAIDAGGGAAASSSVAAATLGSLQQSSALALSSGARAKAFGSEPLEEVHPRFHGEGLASDFGFGVDGRNVEAMVGVARIQLLAMNLSAAVEDTAASWEVPRASLLRVATWNLACFEQANPSTIAAALVSVDADVICTNEDIEFTAETSHSMALSIPGYRKASTCRAEPLWHSEPMWELGGRYLQNAIYIRESTVEAVHTFSLNISDESLIGPSASRCAAFADLRPIGPSNWERRVPVRVASAQLTGGRFVDSEFWKLRGEKAFEVRAILRSMPDIILGDFNSYPDESQVMRFQSGYKPLVDAWDSGRLPEFCAWATDGTRAAERARYRRLPANENTTVFGGTVDHIFLRANSLLVAKTWEVLGGKSIGNFRLSDHDLLVASLLSL